jgi:hypothetical protein
MTTKTKGGAITGLLALTVEAQVAMNVGDAVHVTGPYEVGLANGTKPVLGVVSVANKAPQFGTTVRGALVPGVVTVEARGFFVRTTLVAGIITAGQGITYAAAGVVAVGTAGAGTEVVGIALTASTAAGQTIDILFI